MAYKYILYEVADKILTITLNRPDKLNAWIEPMGLEIIDALDQADADDEVRAIIFTGAGRGYCAGADLSAGAETFDYEKRATEDLPERNRDGGGLTTLRLYECKKPVIAAINGPAAGIGVTMTLAMDIRIASETARFGFVFSRRGIVPEACSTWFLPRIVGISKALEWMYSGRVFPAHEALEAGLVRRVVRPEELLPEARKVAREIADNTSAVSIALIRQTLWRMLGADHPMEAHKLDSRGIVAMGQAPDAYEGVASFLEKRQPKFSMKPSTDMPDYYPWWQPREFE